MNRKQLSSVQYAAQGFGAVFVGVFLAAFLFSIPTKNVLHGQPVYHYLLAISGGLFLVLTLASLAMAFIAKPTE